ncbi:hypothetical protein FGB62_92g021 [Gracilaria domingensis]|nr:hypothetical protein FGB62_92g021 [Gracilaria domingensis]
MCCTRTSPQVYECNPEDASVRCFQAEEVTEHIRIALGNEGPLKVKLIFMKRAFLVALEVDPDREGSVFERYIRLRSLDSPRRRGSMAEAVS